MTQLKLFLTVRQHSTLQMHFIHNLKIPSAAQELFPVSNILKLQATATILTFAATQLCAVNASGIGSFVGLGCYAKLSSAPCTPWSTMYGSGNHHSTRVVIECGQCVTMDLLQGMLTLSNGLDIRCELVFADYMLAKLTVLAPMVFVQGELEVKSTKPVDGLPADTFLMTGEQDQYSESIGENANTCSDGSKSDAGKKGIAVAGGRVTLQGIPSDLSTWMNIEDVSDDLNSIVVKASTVQDRWAAGAKNLITSSTRNGTTMSSEQLHKSYRSKLEGRAKSL
jgi:G8 domain